MCLASQFRYANSGCYKKDCSLNFKQSCCVFKEIKFAICTLCGAKDVCSQQEERGVRIIFDVLFGVFARILFWGVFLIAKLQLEQTLV